MRDQELQHAYSDGDIDTNLTNNRDLGSIVDERYSRRQTLLGGLGASSAAFLGTTLLAACDIDAFGGDDGLGAFFISAGSTGTTSSGNLVTLTGTQGAGTAAGVQWTQVSGPPVQLAGAATSSATFIAPAVASSTPFEFRFTATGANGQTSAQNTTVTVTPAVLSFAPVAKNLNDIV